MRGIVLAGGTGSRLWPITKVTSKQLLPVYDKPMIYYPISLLMAAGIREFSIITTFKDRDSFESLLGNGAQWGVTFEFVCQESPKGLPDAFNLIDGEKLTEGSLLVLGDNLFYGSKIAQKVIQLMSMPGAGIFGYLVNDVSEFGSFELDLSGEITKLSEKVPTGRGLAIPGIYKFDGSVHEYAKGLAPSKRGELEITDLLRLYLSKKKLSYQILDRGTAWLDTGTVDNLNQAAELIRVIQSRQGMLVGSPDEVALRSGLISPSSFEKLVESYGGSQYSKSLLSALNDYEF